MIHAILTQGFTTQLSSEDHQILADEPQDIGGSNKGFTPQQLLLAALASCICITLKMYANRKGWQLSSIEVNADFANNNFDQISTTILVKGELNELQKTRLLEIATKCPMHKLLTGNMGINTKLNHNLS
ncbi:MAG TPA: OsmC family protein [Cytophagaceae bacterium]